MSATDGIDIKPEYKPPVEEKIEKKIPPSARVVYGLLKKNGSLTAKDILKECDLAPRTVRYALKKLLDAELIKRLPNLQDMRQNIYKIREAN